jgi:hypothetical protein
MQKAYIFAGSVGLSTAMLAADLPDKVVHKLALCGILASVVVTCMSLSRRAPEDICVSCKKPCSNGQTEHEECFLDRQW